MPYIFCDLGYYGKLLFFFIKPAKFIILAILKVVFSIITRLMGKLFK